MAPLTPADVKRWDADAIHAVFQTATNRAATLQTLGDSLQQVHNNLSEWHGEAGDAFRADIGKTRRDIEADGQESRQVAGAVSRAEADVRAVKSELDGIEQTAESYGFSITPDWRIDAGVGAIGFDEVTLVAEEQLLQEQLDACKQHAHNADQELANAVRAAVGEPPTSAGAPGAGAPAPGSTAGATSGKPKTWQDMLLPGGPASPEPGADPTKGPPVPAGAGGPPSLQDLMLGRGQPADQKPPPGDPLGMLSQLKPPVVPPQRLNPADIESFKALARKSMIADGVPPDQIESRLNDVVARTQQWMDAGMPHYEAPQPPKPPPPGFGEGFGDRWNSSITGIQDLVGANGLDKMGDAWSGMAKGLGQKAEEALVFGPAAPFVDAVGEVKSFADNPSYYLGERAADGALSAPAMMFGGTGAAVEAGLPAQVVTEGGAPLAVMRGWDPLGGMSWDDFATHFGTPETRAWPGNDGFPAGYELQPAHLPEGTIIDRFGSEYGRYLAPDGTPFADRALPPESSGGDYNRYMVTGKGLPPGWQIVEGPVEPFYGQTPSPGTLQYMIQGPEGVTPTVQELVRLGILDNYGPRLGR
ncbi:glycohydrolase toxin TNT-related protein [Mycobacterium paraterrae]|uniref:Glycohydrolase toxin TNT-related protein n=1 Tax=Mycobacterium paraterrae TaxID=577492 RepID=A0ABY3VFK7_9MYCO|nr:glycohydrolase toxin TNT-related protein [Mycobacterium paraterrae]UMB68202.1 glycohydrolase toxin TNT-related protein [Mycobacterium paraterrae]